MKFEIVKLNEYCGKNANIYSVYLEDEKLTLFDQFIENHEEKYQKELSRIDERLKIIGRTTGAREQFFKGNQGKSGDLLCYLIYEKGQILRLYCLRFGMTAIIIGSGGTKEKEFKAFQEKKELKEENYKLRKISELIYTRIKEGDLKWSKDGRELIGNLKFEEDE